MKRRLLFLSLLTTMFISVIFAGGPAKGYCPYYDTCVSNYRACMSWCGGDPTCEYYCKSDYTSCICSNCGSCPPGGLP